MNHGTGPVDSSSTVADTGRTTFLHRAGDVEVHAGHGMLEQLGDIVAALGGRRVVLTCGTGMADRDSVQRTVEILGPALIDLLEVRPHCPIDDVRLGAARVREARADAVVAVGGGSAIDMAKAIAATMGERLDLAEAAATQTEPGGVVFDGPRMPVIALPTTFSGSETGPGFGVTMGDGRKATFRGRHDAPSAAILDPRLPSSARSATLGASAMNAIAHCIEGGYSRTRHPFTDALAMRALRLLVANVEELPVAMNQNLPRLPVVLLEMQVASAMAGFVMAEARMGLHHALCHQVAVTFGLTHGLANAILLPTVVAFNTPDARDAIRDMEREIRAVGDDSPGGALVRFLVDVRRTLGLPGSLEEAGVRATPDQLERVATRVMASPGSIYNPRRINDPSEVVQLLRAA